MIVACSPRFWRASAQDLIPILLILKSFGNQLCHFEVARPSYEVGHQGASLPHSPNPADSVKEVNARLRKLKLYHVLNIQSVEAPRCQVITDHNWQLLTLKEHQSHGSTLYRDVGVVRQ